MDAGTRLGVERIDIVARHGAYEDERKRSRRFQVDVYVTGNWGDAVASDKLDDTLDYDAIVHRIREVSGRRTYHLIESFAGAIADDVLQSFPDVSDVCVRVRKLGLRAWGRRACATARVTRRRTEDAA